MSYEDTFNDLELDLSSNLEDAPIFELFFADGEMGEDENGLFWKDILREGEWAYRPGTGQKPVAVPLKIVAGKSSKAGEISMAEIIESFEDNAVDHVTVPTSHDDKPHENTGFVKALKVVERDGKKVLRAGISFTEKDIEGKASRGTIANTSAGIIFDYVKKDSGKSYNQVLGHVALTNKPWINGMKPFGVLASEEFADTEIVPLLLESVVWDTNRSLFWMRDKVSKAINPSGETGFYVADIMPNRALVTKFDAKDNSEENFVVPFQIRSDGVKVAGEDKWIPASRKWVEAALSEQKDFQDFNGDINALFEEAPESGAGRSDPEQGGNNMGSSTKDKDAPGAPSDNPATETVLSEEVLSELREQVKVELSADYESLADENKALRKLARGLAVDRRINELKEVGFSEHPGLLSEIRNIMLADNADKEVLTLSEEVDGEAKEVSLSGLDIVERIITALPTKEDGTLALGETLLEANAGETPPETTKDERTEEERIAQLAEELDITLPTKDGDA